VRIIFSVLPDSKNRVRECSVFYLKGIVGSVFETRSMLAGLRNNLLSIITNHFLDIFIILHGNFLSIWSKIKTTVHTPIYNVLRLDVLVYTYVNSLYTSSETNIVNISMISYK